MALADVPVMELAATPSELTSTTPSRERAGTAVCTPSTAAIVSTRETSMLLRLSVSSSEEEDDAVADAADDAAESAGAEESSESSVTRPCT